jgi:hypothetical protein
MGAARLLGGLFLKGHIQGIVAWLSPRACHQMHLASLLVGLAGVQVHNRAF